MSHRRNVRLENVIDDSDLWRLAKRFGSVILLESAISVNGQKLDQIKKSYHKISSVIKDNTNIFTGLISYKGNTPYKRMDKIGLFPDFIFRIGSYNPEILYKCCDDCTEGGGLKKKHLKKLISEYNAIIKHRNKKNSIDVLPAFTGSNNPNCCYSNEVGYIFEKYVIEAFRDVLCCYETKIKQRVISGKPKRREDKEEGDTDIVIFCDYGCFRKQMNVLKAGFDKGGWDISCRIRNEDKITLNYKE